MTEKTLESVKSHPTAGLETMEARDLAIESAVFEPAELAKQIELLPSALWLRGEAREVRVELLPSPRQEHRVFEILIITKDGLQRLIGKVYLQDRQDVYTTMEQIRRAGFDSDSEFSIPQPVAYIPALRLLLQEKVEGTPASEIFMRGERHQCAEAAARTARWLARFHAIAPIPGRVSDVKGFLKVAERKCRLMTEADKALRTRSEALVEGLKEAAGSLGSTPVRPGHGDFCERQIIFAEKGTSVVDWDDYDLADPARDVAKFMVSLERLARKFHGSSHALDGAVEVFLQTYLAASGHLQVIRHVPFYKAVLYLKGRKNAIQNKAEGWRHAAELMLDDSYRSLQGWDGTRAGASLLWT